MSLQYEPASEPLHIYVGASLTRQMGAGLDGDPAEANSPTNRQLNILIGNSKQWVDDFVGELTF